MRVKILVMAVGLIAASAYTQAQECASIKQDKQRLACYDKAATTQGKAAAPAPVPAVSETPAKAEQSGDKVVFKSKSWHVHQELDAMTDKKSCTALYRNEWKVQGTANALYIGYKGRGGVKYYTLRVDDEPADSLQSATSTEKSIGAIIIDSNFNRIYNGKRLRAQVGTILGSLLTEDIDLTGLKESVDYIRANCGS